MNKRYKILLKPIILLISGIFLLSISGCAKDRPVGSSGPTVYKQAD